ncbi:polysaccharide lyase family 1 protein [Dothidotthia symphoricarpi CBS 119687]|uniref:Polysaccharide lyase family 1 protein n=1 Tax=Dothidotthia symphoricarpi CBS 119687 TaxID=1392245 RepID=A0A6A6AG66_9PLEO|nr:polysaccharide lyase family 1 protein [Dothidotthia symphoricarpi CBS 119687]KAF2129411.1 polysaccharide lyase family 1 protein [Dothidotthia symphoricarpi CBS 119687]
MRFFEIATAALTAASTAYASPIEKRAAKVDELVGFAAGTTGGGSGAGTTVASCAELTAAAKVGGVIKVKGALTGCGIIKLVDNTSILGVGTNAGLTDSGFQVRKVTNVIIRNLKLYRAPEGKDLIDIDESTKIWIDHNDFSSVGVVGDKDTYDGLLDAKHGSDFLTFSWNKFHDHWKGSLIGHSDNNAAQDTGKLHLTYHHNSFAKVNSRLPSVRFGTVHIYNACVNGGISGVNSRMGAQVFVESSSFTNTANAIVTNLDSDLEGFANEKNNVYTNSTTQITQKGTWTPTYSYTVDAAASACSIVTASAGVGVVTF